MEANKIPASGKDEDGMKHSLQIGVSPGRYDDAVVKCDKVTVREKLLRFLLGVPTRLTVLIPGDTVDELCITEKKEAMKNGN